MYPEGDNMKAPGKFLCPGASFDFVSPCNPHNLGKIPIFRREIRHPIFLEGSMRIAVFGTGGIGGYFGGRLAQAGEDVMFIARGEHLEAMRSNGLRVDSVKGDFIIKPVQATDDPKQVGIVDMILVGVKA
jgi:hypothetical protein